MSLIEVGRLLRAGVAGFVLGCPCSLSDRPAFGTMVRAPLDGDYQVYGLIHEIHIDDDGLVRQLVTASTMDSSIIADNRLNRIVPLEMSVLAVGYSKGDRIFHLLPPRPPLSLDSIYLCQEAEIIRFTVAGRFGYFRHILRSSDLPIPELFAAHLQQAQAAHEAAGNSGWANQAAQELITLLRDDYPTLMAVLSAISDALPEYYRS